MPEARPASGRLSVNISEYGDPIKIGEGTAYVITLKNNRPTPDQDVVVTIEMPTGLVFKTLSGPANLRNTSSDGRTIQVNPIREVRANETLPPFRLEATGRQAGEQHLKVTVTSRLSPQGVTAEETTTVFDE